MNPSKSRAPSSDPGLCSRESCESERMDAPKILLVEDNPSNQKLCVLILGKLGYVPDLASDGLEALDAMRARSYDVVFMDVQMPKMNGLEACRTIRQERPDLRRPWIIALTAHAFEADRDACFAAGMNDYLTKPIRRDLLEAALRRALGVKDGGTEGAG